MKINKAHIGVVAVVTVVLAIFVFGVVAILAPIMNSNRQVIDITYNFDDVIIAMPNGDIIEGKVQRWLDFENSDMIQVKIDGKIYLTHINNVLLIAND